MTGVLGGQEEVGPDHSWEFYRITKRHHRPGYTAHQEPSQILQKTEEIVLAAISISKSILYNCGYSSDEGAGAGSGQAVPPLFSEDQLNCRTAVISPVLLSSYAERLFHEIRDE